MRILDTDTCIEILRGNERVIGMRAEVVDEVATTWITAAELYYGASKSSRPEHNRKLVSAFLGTLQIRGLDLAAVQIFGEAKAMLERKDLRLADADLLIAAIALSKGARVVTGNRKHYQRIPGVILEDWMRA